MNSRLRALLSLPLRTPAALKRSPKARRALTSAVVATCVVIFAFCVVVAIQARRNKERFPNQAAETLRSIFGHALVSGIESAFYTNRERVRRFLFAKRGIVDRDVLAQIQSPASPNAPGVEGPDRPDDLQPLILSPALGGEGLWNPVKAVGDGLFVTRMRPDASDASEFATLVAIDLRKLDLHFVPGSESTGDESLSKVPNMDLPSLVAIFNGGFRGRSGWTGLRKNGTIYRPLKAGRASIVITPGDAQIVKWSLAEAARFPSADVRQNLPPLLDGGKYSRGFLADWHLAYPTKRTALGKGRERRWLFFAEGRGLDPEEIAVALQLARCTEAMHLDQNTGNVMFDIARRHKGRVEFRDIDPSLHHPRTQKFLSGSNRDFFYLTARKRGG